MTVPSPGWSPDPARAAASRIADFGRWLAHEGRAILTDPTEYAELQRWSADSPGDFWRAAADFFAVEWAEEPTADLAERRMPGAVWFPDGRLNLGHHLLRRGRDDRDAVVLVSEGGEVAALSHAELRTQAAAVAGHLRAVGVRRGDVVAAYLPNCLEGVVSFVACALVGAVWAQAGLDLGAPAAVDRLQQLDPAALIAGTGYRFGGRTHDRRDQVTELGAALPGLRHTLVVGTGGVEAGGPGDGVSTWSEALAAQPVREPEPVPFDHPLWVLFSSGTTGRPKGIVHGHGGVLLEQLVSTGLHMDLDEDDVFFWYTTPNWMMWNAQVCGLLQGSTVVLYDGRPTWPEVDALWRLAARHDVTVLGTSPGYLEASQRAGLSPGADLDLRRLRLLGVTGAVLPRSANAWVRTHVSPDLQVGSMSGGTDVVGVFAASAPTLPVYDGEISGVALGVAMEVWDEDGRPLPAGQAGEMVITEPMPSMPVCLWDDPDGERLRETYFARFPGVWRHGDLTVLTERGSVVILGRSDATLNRHGVRLGSAEIYAALADLREVEDALVVGVELPDGRYWLPLFVVPGDAVDPEVLAERVRRRIAERASPRHVPDEVVVVPSLPHTRTGKRLEVPVKRILQGADPESVLNRTAVDDVDAWERLVAFASARAGRKIDERA